MILYFSICPFPVAPLKAVVSERHGEWLDKFNSLGLSCAEVTGDTEDEDYSATHDANIILTTPEKLDSITRRWRDASAPLLTKPSLLLVDEVRD